MKKFSMLSLSLIIALSLCACSYEKTSLNTEDETTVENKITTQTTSQEDKDIKEKSKNYSDLIKSKLFSEFNFDDSFEITLEEYIVDDEKLELLDQTDLSEMMSITDCSLISVKENQNKLICINYSEVDQLKAFDLYRLENNQIIVTY